jgi:hypothetical protein
LIHNGMIWSEAGYIIHMSLRLDSELHSRHTIRQYLRVNTTTQSTCLSSTTRDSVVVTALFSDSDCVVLTASVKELDFWVRR